MKDLTLAIATLLILVFSNLTEAATYSYRSDGQVWFQTVKSGGNSLVTMPEDLKISADLMGGVGSGEKGNASAFGSVTMHLNSESIDTNDEEPMQGQVVVGGITLDLTSSVSEGEVADVAIGDVLTLTMEGGKWARQPTFSLAYSQTQLFLRVDIKNTSADTTYEVDIVSFGSTSATATIEGPKESAATSATIIDTPPELIDFMEQFVGLTEEEAQELFEGLPEEQQEIFLENYHVLSVMTPNTTEPLVFGKTHTIEIPPMQTQKYGLFMIGNGLATVVPEPSSGLMVLLVIVQLNYPCRLFRNQKPQQ